MITPLLRLALDPVHRRHRQLRRLIFGAGWMLGTALLCGALFFCHAGRDWIVITLFVSILARVWLRRKLTAAEPDYTSLARQIEARHPELHALLLTAVEQQPDAKTRRLTFLQQKVIADAVAASRRLNLVAAVPARQVWAARLAHLAALLALGFVLFQVLVETRLQPPQLAPRRERPAQAVTVTPGDTRLERGSGLVVLADFHRDVPSEATLIIQPKNLPPQRVPLVRNLDDPVFGGGLPEVDADLTYRIEYAGQATREYSVKVFEHPRLERVDATLRFPEYTKLPEKKVPDTRRVSAVEGTALEVIFQLNKPVTSATLVAKDGTKVPLAVAADQASVSLAGFPVKASQTYELKLEDAEGLANKVPAQFVVEALPNRRPELKFQTPKGDQRVSQLEEVAFRAEAWDDFGLARYGLTVQIAGGPPQQHELGVTTRADEKREFTHLLKLEEVGVKPDDLVSWHLWAEDIGPDGQPRRSETDIFFAEVRPFEEIFRRGDGSGQGEGGNETSKLAELQKQIITATWNLKRAEDARPAGEKEPSPKYLKDEPVVRDSQAHALEQTRALEAKLEDPKLLPLAANAVKEMQAALDHLDKAAQTPAPLPDALAAEQAAYNALLKLSAHEFRVSKGRGKGKEKGGQQQQQLDALEMQEEKQRYETKREAESPQNEQQREQLAILSRLKELAQRQQDINERLKELQNALQAAQTDAEKEEIRRQLKRLREEEQQLLADLDETRQKMEQSPQQAQLAGERQQLEQTRAEAQKTAEALEKGETSKALASGTRTQRDLQQMRDDFRKKTSGQFNEAMREMRTDARALAESQQAIAEKLQAPTDKPERRTLDGSSEREQLTQQLEKQRENLGGITDRMKTVSEQAEAAEPLLAKELYDTLRKTTQAATSDTLEKTQLLAQRGYEQQARKFEEKARAEIDELKSGVERAAGSVLGDEAEALRKARAELDALRGEIEREIGRARPDLAEATALAGEQKSSAGEGSAKEGQQPGEPAGKPPGEDSENGQGQKPGAQQRGKSGSTSPEGETGPQPSGQKGAPSGKQPGEEKQAGEEGQQGGGKTAQQKAPPGQGEGQSSSPSQGEGQGKGQAGQQPGTGEGGRTAQASQGQAPGEGTGTPGGSGSSAQEPISNPQGKLGDKPGARLSEIAGGPRQRGGIRSGTDNGGGLWGGGVEGEQAGPLTGEKFTEWSDRLRNIEEMVDDPATRAELARVREIAKGERVNFKRHSVQPNWDLVKTKIGTPLAELRNRLTEELARRESKENLVPIDRDPVPGKYAERVRRYYEELGRSR